MDAPILALITLLNLASFCQTIIQLMIVYLSDYNFSTSRAVYETLEEAREALLERGFTPVAIAFVI